MWRAALYPAGALSVFGATCSRARTLPPQVISRWQPMGQDWTADIRACDSVVEYLLLGETVRVRRASPSLHRITDPVVSGGRLAAAGVCSTESSDMPHRKAPVQLSAHRSAVTQGERIA